jgi:hypothetical protein
VLAAHDGELSAFFEDRAIGAATEYAGSHPAEVAQSILTVAAGREDAPGTWTAIATWLGWWEPAAASAAMTRMIGCSVDAAAALVAPQEFDSWKRVPALAVAQALERHDSVREWAADMLECFFRAWGGTDLKHWEWIAALLSAPDPSVAVRVVSEFLGVQDWARKDPWPTAYEGHTVPERLLTQTPYAQLFPQSEPRVAQAAAEATALENVIRRAVMSGHTPGPWLTALAAALPGCGQHSCCRMSLFEAELLRRGHSARRWPELPDRLTAPRAWLWFGARGTPDVVTQGGTPDLGWPVAVDLLGADEQLRAEVTSWGRRNPGGIESSERAAWVAEGRLLYDRLRAVLEPTWTLMWAVHERPPHQDPVGSTDHARSRGPDEHPKRTGWTRRNR